MEFNFWKKKDKPFLVLDIGTEAVKALVVKKSNNSVVVMANSLQYFEQYPHVLTSDGKESYISPWFKGQEIKTIIDNG